MSRVRSSIMAVAVLGFLFASMATAGEEKATLKTQTKCPIKDGKIDKTLFADVSGQRVYVCCKGCAAKVKANPEAALKKIAENSEFAESLQKTCIVSGKLLENKDRFVNFAGRNIYVCCKNCQRKVTKDPAKYAKLLTAKFAKKTAQEDGHGSAP